MAFRKFKNMFTQLESPVTFCGILLLQFYTFKFVHCGCNLDGYTDDVQMQELEKKLLQTIEPLKGEVFQAKAGIYTYDVRICDTVKGGKAGVGAVQYVSKGDVKDHAVMLGLTTHADIYGGSGSIILVYYNGTEYGSHCGNNGRSTQIMITCDPNNLRGEFKHLGEKRRNDSTHCSYMFELRSKVACIGDEVCFKNNSEGLSTGSVFCILFFTFFGLYVIGGFLYKRMIVGAKGLEQIPNYSFWREFGNLQADACDFVCRCGPRQESHAYRGIDGRLKEAEERDEQLLN